MGSDRQRSAKAFRHGRVVFAALGRWHRPTGSRRRFALALICATAILGTVTSALAATWTTQTPPPAGPLNGVSCPSNTVCYAVGNNGTVLTTSDGGTNWSATTSPTTDVLSAVACPSTSTCYVADEQNPWVW